MPDILPYLMFGIFLSVAGAYVWLHRLYEKKRTEHMRAFADSLGLSFDPVGDPNLVNVLIRFQLFAQGGEKSIRNMIHGATEDVKLAIFDYEFVIYIVKHRKRVTQTVVHFGSQLLALPEFAVHPKMLASRLDKILGWDDIDFDTHPQFSSAYWLQGSNEEHVRALFRAPVLEWFEGNPYLSAEGCGTRLIVYRSSNRSPSEEMSSVMKQGFELYELLRSPT